MNYNVNQNLPDLPNDRENGIQASIEDLNLALKYLTDSLEILDSKLNPFLRPDDRSVGETNVKSAVNVKSDVRSLLDSHIDRVYSATSFLNDLTHRLDV